MKEEERNRKIEILQALKRRKHEREVQLAKFGVNADPIIPIDLEEINRKIADIEDDVRSLNYSYMMPNAGYARIDITTSKSNYRFEITSDDIQNIVDKALHYIDEINKKHKIHALDSTDIMPYYIIDPALNDPLAEELSRQLLVGTQRLTIKSKDVDEVRNALIAFAGDKNEDRYKPARKRKRRKRA